MRNTAHVSELELKVLFEISQIIGQALDLDQTLEAVLGILSDTLAMQRATVILRDEETEILAIRASHGLSAEEKARGVYRLDEGVTGRIFSTGQPFVVPDISKEPLFLDRTKARSMHRERLSFLGVPITLGGVPVGVLTVDRLFSDDVGFDEDVRFLSIVAALIAQFVQLARSVKAREEKLRDENASLRAKLSDNYQRFFIVGKSPAMQRVHQMIERVAKTKATVLLLGESGTGKTLAARIIHELSDRNGKPFIKVNCAALPENLLESELFGYEKGAFTGATNAKPGRIEEADQGGLFLDEIGELTLSTQAKLLRFLQEREFERLGSTKTRTVDVRIIAATNRDLAEAVADGGFREDLYYRLNVFPIRVPALRERFEDIPALLNHFLSQHSKVYGRRLSLTPEALEALVSHDWPGNVREMENLIERLSILAEGDKIGVRDIEPALESEARLGQAQRAARQSDDRRAEDRRADADRGRYPERSSGRASWADRGRGRTDSTGHGPGGYDQTGREARDETGGQSLQEIERREILSALERNGFVQSRAAKDLGITLRQMGYRIKKFQLEDLVNEQRGRRLGLR